MDARFVLTFSATATKYKVQQTTIQQYKNAKYKIPPQVTIHTDTLNESCSLEGSVAAFKGRTIHTYHSEGAGGGHAPDIIAVCGEENVIPSSTNPTRCVF